MVVGFDLVVVHNGFAIVVVMEVATTDVVRFYFILFYFFKCRSYFSILVCQSSIFLAHQILMF